MRAIAVALSVPLLIAACSAGTGSNGAPTPSPAESPLEPGPVPADLFAAMVADAAGRGAVDESAVAVVTSEAVTWSDGSLGCPEPGMFYTQALVAGYQVVLEAGGVRYDYHAGQRGGFTLCPPDRAKPPVEGGGAI